MQPVMVQDPATGQMVMMQPVAMGAQPGVQQGQGQPPPQYVMGQAPANGANGTNGYEGQQKPQVGQGSVQMGAPVADPNAKRQSDPREKDPTNDDKV